MLAGSILLFGSVRTGYDGTNGQTDTASFSKDGETLILHLQLVWR